jgi:G:T-mismatch repair DNA endonuclease (very short patch repair protein)
MNGSNRFTSHRSNVVFVNGNFVHSTEGHFLTPPQKTFGWVEPHQKFVSRDLTT